MTKTELAEKVKTVRSKLDEITSEMTDEKALESAVLFRKWSGDGVALETGQRVTYNDVLYKVLQPHTSQADWTPDTSPSLFAKVLIPDENVIPEWIQPDSTNAYMAGDKVTFNGKVYESLMDGNIWSPAEYPIGWTEVKLETEE
jgi:hypothetical protein